MKKKNSSKYILHTKLKEHDFVKHKIVKRFIKKI